MIFIKLGDDYYEFKNNIEEIENKKTYNSKRIKKDLQKYIIKNLKIQI
mgnify:FL=1